MDLELDDEQQALRDTVRRCLADRAPINPYVRDHVAGTPWHPDEAWSTLAAIGATAVVVPGDLGGLGLGMVEAAIVAEEAGRALYPGPLAASSVGAALALLAAADREAVAGHLGTIADGSTVGAAVVPVPLSLGHPSFHVESGRVSGSASGVLGAVSADLLVVAARDGDDLALVAVWPGAEGVTVTRDASVDRSRDLASVVLDQAAGDPLGTIPARALRAVGDALLVAVAADALGAASAVLDLAVAYAKERQQFGQPIGAFQAVQHLCVDMLETVELARGGVLHAAWAVDSGADDAHLAAARVKGFADRLATVGDTAIQVFGGIGYTWEHDSHLYLKRLLTWSAYLGSPAQYRRELGRAVATGAC